jgi:hypothetical protein
LQTHCWMQWWFLQFWKCLDILRFVQLSRWDTEKKNHAVHEACRNYKITMTRAKQNLLLADAHPIGHPHQPEDISMSSPTATNMAWPWNHQNWFRGSRDSPTSMECHLDDLPSNLKNLQLNIAATVCGSNRSITCILLS